MDDRTLSCPDKIDATALAQPPGVGMPLAISRGAPPEIGTVASVPSQAAMKKRLQPTETAICDAETANSSESVKSNPRDSGLPGLVE